MSDRLPPASVDIPEFVFEGYFGCRSTCRVRIYRRVGRPAVVVATETATNPGTSITNAVEDLATAVMRDFELPRHGFIWIEHYDKARIGRLEDDVEEEASTFDVVEFCAAVDAPWRPSWRSIQEADVLALLQPAEG